MSKANSLFRVAVVTNSSWNLLNFRRGIILALAEAGHEVFLVAPRRDEEAEPDDLPGTHLTIHHLHRRGTQPLRDLLLARELCRIYREHRIDWAFHFTAKPVVYGSLAARWVGVKSIATLTGLGYTFLRSHFTASLMKRLYAFSLRTAEAVFYHNPDDRALLLKAGVGAPDRSFVVGGSGISLDQFPCQPFHRAIPGRFLFVARLLSDKGIHEYVAAARRARELNPDLTFQVLGPFDPGNPSVISPNELAAWTNDGTINYAGSVADVRPYLEQASVVVLPSYREGLPRVLLEGGATGRPLLTTDVPGCRAVVADGDNGLLVPARDAEALARAMLKMAAMPQEELRAMGLRARAVVEEKFDQRLVNEAYLRAVNRHE